VTQHNNLKFVIAKIEAMSMKKIIEIFAQLLGFAFVFFLIKLLIGSLLNRWGFETMVSYLLLLLLIKETVRDTILKIMDTVIR